MKIKNLMLFIYDFPHKKTQDFIFRLMVENFSIKYVIAAPWHELNIPASSVRIAPSHSGLIHPKHICSRFNIKYLVANHNSHQSLNFLMKNPVDLYIISGARILSKQVRQTANNLILNIHPGMLPEIRGLDTILWSIYYSFPIGITAHFIGDKIDAGILLYKEPLSLRSDDTIINISLRLIEKQADVLIKSIDVLRRSDRLDLINLDKIESQYHTKMSTDLEQQTIRNFPRWLKKFSKG